MGRELSVTNQQIRDLPEYQSSTSFSQLEKLAIDLAARMTQTPVEVRDELFAALRQNFNDAQMVELTAAIAWENYRARFDHTMGIEAEGFSEGAVCALPERPPTQAAQVRSASMATKQRSGVAHEE